MPPKSYVLVEQRGLIYSAGLLITVMSQAKGIWVCHITVGLIFLLHFKNNDKHFSIGPYCCITNSHDCCSRLGAVAIQLVIALFISLALI